MNVIEALNQLHDCEDLQGGRDKFWSAFNTIKEFIELIINNITYLPRHYENQAQWNYEEIYLRISEIWDKSDLEKLKPLLKGVIKRL